MSRVALIQMCSSDDPAENLASAREMIAMAAADGAELVITPEVTNCVSADRSHQRRVLRHEAEDPVLAGLCAQAGALEIWLCIGSLALLTGDEDGRFANRSFLVAPSGKIVARYDKIHMFDVDVSATETYRESAGFRPGRTAVVATTPLGRIGMSICYDVRFAHLYRALAKAGAELITVPAAFSTVTGAAHWEVLLRARAIETGTYVLAAAQTGRHGSSTGAVRDTWGHSMLIDPWGRILAQGGTEPGIIMGEIDLAAVADARRRIGALNHDRDFGGPA